MTSTTPLTFRVKDNDYVVDRITAGHLLEIEQQKAMQSNFQYGAILSNRTKWSNYILDNIDMFAHLQAFFPKLMEDMKVKSWKELDPFDLEELKTQYYETFIPWFEEFGTALFAIIDKRNAKDEQQSQK